MQIGSGKIGQDKIGAADTPPPPPTGQLLVHPGMDGRMGNATMAGGMRG